MNERPPNEDDEVDEQYRRASARDASRPSESVRHAVLRHAAELAAQRAAQGGPVQSAPDQNVLGAGRTVDAGPVKFDFKQPAANEWRWRPAAYGGLAAAALAGLLIAPHFLPPSPPATSSPPQAVMSASKKTEAAATTPIEAPQTPAAEASPAVPPPALSAQGVPAPAMPAPAMRARTVPPNAPLAPPAGVPAGTSGASTAAAYAAAGAAAAGAATASTLEPHDRAAPALAAKPPAFARRRSVGESRAGPRCQTARVRRRSAAQRERACEGLARRSPAALRPASAAHRGGPRRGAPAAAPSAQVVGASALLTALAAARAHAPIDSATALRQAAQSGDTLRLKALLDEQIDVDARDPAGRTALMLAVIAGQVQAVDALLARGADPNAADSSGTTPLSAAFAANHADIIAALRRAGAH